MNHKGTKTIETQRLILRPFRAGDERDMFENWAKDPEVTRFLAWPAHESRAVTRGIINGWVEQAADARFYLWCMQLRETGEAVGSITVSRLEEPIEAGEIGYCLGQSYWRRGLTPEALNALLPYLFCEVGFNRLVARHDTENPASGAVMRKAGLRLEGIARQGGRNNLGLRDMAVYAILREEFLAAAGHGTV